jgi:hypothetical protein
MMRYTLLKIQFFLERPIFGRDVMKLEPGRGDGVAEVGQAVSSTMSSRGGWEQS